MILELCDYRGTMLWLDGEKPAGRWQTGDGEAPGELTVSEYDSPTLAIGEHRVTKVTISKHRDNKPGPGANGYPWYHIFGMDCVPEEITLTTEAGTFTGPITLIETCSPDAEEAKIIRLQNGEDYEIDETMMFIRADLTKQPQLDLTDEQFMAAKKRYAECSSLADREGGDSGSSPLKYWIGWLDTMDRDTFAKELENQDEEYRNHILKG